MRVCAKSVLCNDSCDNGVQRMQDADDDVNGEFDNKISTDRMFCTGPVDEEGGNLVDVCKGDSGGPLVRKVSGVIVLLPHI